MERRSPLPSGGPAPVSWVGLLAPDFSAEHTMPRYVALLRGVSPMNARMPELKACFESAGFTSVRTVLSSGNVAFDSEHTNQAAIEAMAEHAMKQALGRTFHAIIHRLPACGEGPGVHDADRKGLRQGRHHAHA